MILASEAYNLTLTRIYEIFQDTIDKIEENIKFAIQLFQTETTLYIDGLVDPSVQLYLQSCGYKVKKTYNTITDQTLLEISWNLHTK